MKHHPPSRRVAGRRVRPRHVVLLTGVGLVPLVGVGPVAASGASCAPAQFLPSRWTGSGYLSIDDFDGTSIIGLESSAQFWLDVSDGGTVADGAMTIDGGGIINSLATMDSASSATWHYEGRIQGVGSGPSSYGTLSTSMAAVISIAGADGKTEYGPSHAGFDAEWSNDATYELEPTESDCLTVRGEIDDALDGMSLSWIARRNGGVSPKTDALLDGLEETVREAIDMIEGEDPTIDVVALATMIKKLIGVNNVLASVEECRLAPPGGVSGRPTLGYAHEALVRTLAEFIKQAEVHGNFTTWEVIRVMTLGLQSAAFTVGDAACAREHDRAGELLTRFNRVLWIRLEDAKAAGDREGLLLIANAARQQGWIDLADAAAAAAG